MAAESRSALRGAVCIAALAVWFGAARAEPRPVAGRVVHLSGEGVAAGWYEADDLGAAVASAGGTLRAVDGAVHDGDTLVLSHGWALHARAFAESPVDWTPAPVSANVRVDLNRASAAELEGLPGIGPALARRIVAARPFRTVDALDAVKGIGPKRLAALRDRVVVAK